MGCRSARRSAVGLFPAHSGYFLPKRPRIPPIFEGDWGASPGVSGSGAGPAVSVPLTLAGAGARATSPSSGGDSLDISTAAPAPGVVESKEEASPVVGSSRAGCFSSLRERRRLTSAPDSDDASGPSSGLSFLSSCRQRGACTIYEQLTA